MPKIVDAGGIYTSIDYNDKVRGLKLFWNKCNWGILNVSRMNIKYQNQTNEEDICFMTP